MADAASSSELEKKIVSQIEYYFSDINLERDKFLKTQMKNNEGWLPLDVLLTFNRLKSLSQDKSVILAALAKSSSELLQVDEAGARVRRSSAKPLPSLSPIEHRLEVRNRTAYVKPFPENCTLDELQTFFGGFGKIDSIFMRRQRAPEKTFKGSVLVTFAEKADLEKFLNLKSVTYKDEELLRELEVNHIKRKIDENKQKKAEKKRKREEKKANPKAEPDCTVGTVLVVSNIPAGVTWNALKEKFREHGQVKWVDFNAGDTEAKVRFKEENMATKLVDDVHSNGVTVTIEKNALEVRLLTLDEEKAYWAEVNEAKSKALDNKNRRKGERVRNRIQKRSTINDSDKLPDTGDGIGLEAAATDDSVGQETATDSRPAEDKRAATEGGDEKMATKKIRVESKPVV